MELKGVSVLRSTQKFAIRRKRSQSEKNRNARYEKSLLWKNHRKSFNILFYYVFPA